MIYSRADMIALLRRNTDEQGWLQPLLDDPDSAPVIDALCDIMARVSRAGDYDCNIGSISDSPGGSPGTTILLLVREAAGTEGRIPKGYSFVDARGVRALAATDVPVAIGATSVLVPVQTVRLTEIVNSERDTGFAIDPQSPFVLDVTEAAVLIAPPDQDPPAGYPMPDATTFRSVTSAEIIQGGTSDWLSEHGAERGVRRQYGEETGDYRLRVRNIPDAVAPVPIADGVQAAASRAGLSPVQILEPFEDGATPALKADHGLGSFQPLYTSGTGPPNSPLQDFCDDPVHEMVGLREARAYFRIETPDKIADPDSMRFFCAGAAAESPPNRFGYCDDDVFGYLDVRVHPKVSASLLALWEEADRKRAGGVQFDVYLPLGRLKQGYGETDSAGEAGVLAMAPDPGKSWILLDLHLGHNGAPSGTFPPPGSYHRVRFTFQDATTFTTPPFTDFCDERLTPEKLVKMGMLLEQRIVQIDALAQSDGAVVLSVAVTARVIEFTD